MSTLERVIIILKDFSYCPTLIDINEILKGGSGSGDFGHVGRAGKRGGSGGGGGKGKPRKGRRSREVLDKEIEANRKRNGFGNVQNVQSVTRSQAKVDYDTWQKNLPPDELKALQDYQTGIALFVNDALRAGAIQENQQEIIDSLDKALNKTSLPRDTILHRGTELDVYTRSLGNDPMKWIGRTFTDPGYMSTSISSDEAFDGIKATINVPKGARGGYLDGLADTGRKRFDKGFNDQQEMLLARGTKMRITGVDLDDAGNVQGIATEVIGQG